VGILTAIFALGAIVTAIVGFGIVFAMSAFDLEPGSFEGESAAESEARPDETG
jgi:hypothetical protein